MIESDQQKLII